MFFFFQAEDGIRDVAVTGVQTCALPIWKLGALDFAGGTVVHINAAAAALVIALVLGTRKDYARQAIIPQNVPFTLLGAGLLWFGWFGFNAGSAIGAKTSAALAFANPLFA